MKAPVGSEEWKEKIKRRRERRLARRERLKNKTKNYTIYVLKLENNCWYIGSTSNVDNRFKQHVDKNGGSWWTENNTPISIHETRYIGQVNESSAAKYEDTVTLEYAEKYGKDKVRGGGYCQLNPRWS